MAVIDFVVTEYGRGIALGDTSTASSRVAISGQDTITTVENLEDAGGDIVVSAGQVLRMFSTAKIRVAFGGTAATSTTGHLVPANTLIDIEIARDDAGNVSVIEGA